MCRNVWLSLTPLVIFVSLSVQCLLFCTADHTVLLLGCPFLVCGIWDKSQESGAWADQGSSSWASQWDASPASWWEMPQGLLRAGVAARAQPFALMTLRFLGVTLHLSVFTLAFCPLPLEFAHRKELNSCASCKTKTKCGILRCASELLSQFIQLLLHPERRPCT